ncbi:hypothetical protein [Aliiroseovarius sp.]|uniref:hypothetical protein n=1 Tax=Aliiroseovarius sp. TaxID=1872442 RepID=UPI003BABBEAB
MQGAEVTAPPVSMAVKPGVPAERITGYREPILRSFIEQDGQEAEVVGARCTLDSAELSGEFVTPAYVRLPTMKGKPTPLHISCTTGEQTGTRKVDPALQGVAFGGASPAGLVAAVVSTAIVASADNWGYGADGVVIRIELE